MSTVIFSTDDLPAALDDRARFQRWSEIHSDRYCAFDHSRAGDGAFSACFLFAQFGNVKSSRFDGTVNGLVRTPRHVAKDPNEHFGIAFNRSRGAIQFAQIGRETIAAPGGAMFFTGGAALRIDGKLDVNRTTVAVLRRQILELVATPEDCLLKQLDANEPALRHLSRYLDIILEPSTCDDDPALAVHIETTVIDLVALAIGAQGDAAAIIRARGLREARAQDILAEIKQGFANAAFSAASVGAKLGLSPRYVQELLQDTKSTFTERVLELRLQKARVMLGDPRCTRLKIGEIAFACGFNEPSYFNRCFRRRFGASPTQFRGRA